ELRGPERGEVIVFIYPCDPERDYIKRVVALAGDTVEVRCNVVHVNGVPVPSEMIEPGDKCTYKDYDEKDGHWYTRQCSRYREHVNGITYDTFHDSERPARDDKNKSSPSNAAGDARDFPTRSSPFPPNCTQSEEAKKAANIVQVSGKIVETK